MIERHDHDAIYVAREGGGLGDAVCALPAIDALVAQLGGGRVTVAFEKEFLDLFSGHGCRVEALSPNVRAGIRDGNYRRKFSGPWRGGRFVDLREGEDRHMLETGCRPTLYRGEVMAAACGVTPASYTPAIHTDAGRVAAKRAELEAIAEGRPIVGLAWRSAARDRTWPRAQEWAERAREEWCVIGIDRGTTFPWASASAVTPTAMDCAETVAAFDVLVAPDTGQLHVAAGVGVPAVGIFGPTEGSVICRYYPLATVLQHAEEASAQVGCQAPCRCSALNTFACAGKIILCLAMVTVEEVMEAVAEKVGSRKSEVGAERQTA